MAGSKRRSCPIPSTTRLASQAATAASAAARLSASGFSQNTCLPAAAACKTWPTCSEWGVHRMTASIRGSPNASS